ncbi:MAG: hypothetical protein OEX81_00705 [Candidatus Pacebacteria bacterium]|nr:hypothetical protein [Candidatus Paceibacterota bacterium]
MNLRSKAEVFATDYSGVKYQYEIGPVSEAAPNWFVEGLNCQLLIHLAYKEFFEVTLPQFLRSSEMFADSEWFSEKGLNEIEEGDIIFMGPSFLSPKRDPNDEDAKKLHIAMVTSVGLRNEIEIIHARHNKGIIIESLEYVQKVKWPHKKPYEKVFGIKGIRL